MDGVRFTPFLKNPSVNNVFTDYYYIGLREIRVGGTKAKIDEEALEVGEDGNGGTIIDSGTTFTYMDKKVFEPMFELFVEKVGYRYKRDELAEERTGLRLCYELKEGKEVDLPELVFRFKGGAEMKMPLENYFAVAGDSTATICLTIVTDGGEAGVSGPAVILGSFQQQNYYVVYDLEREKLGFRKQRSCVGT